MFLIERSCSSLLTVFLVVEAPISLWLSSWRICAKDFAWSDGLVLVLNLPAFEPVLFIIDTMFYLCGLGAICLILVDPIIFCGALSLCLFESRIFYVLCAGVRFFKGGYYKTIDFIL